MMLKTRFKPIYNKGNDFLNPNIWGSFINLQAHFIDKKILLFGFSCGLYHFYKFKQPKTKIQKFDRMNKYYVIYRGSSQTTPGRLV